MKNCAFCHTPREDNETCDCDDMTIKELRAEVERLKGLVDVPLVGIRQLVVEAHGPAGAQSTTMNALKSLIKAFQAANLQISAMKEVVRAARGLKAHGSALNGTHANILWKALDALGAE